MCGDIILESEYDLDGPGHACKKMNIENLDSLMYVKCSSCVLFKSVEKDFGYCSMMPDGKNEVSKLYKHCKYKETK